MSKATGHRGRMATRSGQKIIEAKSLRRRYLKNQAR